MVAGLALLAQVYVWRRMVWDTTRPGRARWIGTAVLVGMFLLMLAALLGAREMRPETARWFAWPGYLWIAVLIYSTLALVVLELPRLVLSRRLALRGRVQRHREPARELAEPSGAAAGPEPAESVPAPEEPVDRGRRLVLARGTALAAGVAALGVVGYGASSALGQPNVKRVPVRLDRLPADFSGFRIAVVSDIHLGPLAGAAHTERIVRTINEQQPDLVAIVGDLVDGSPEHLGDAARPLRDLDAPEGSFFVTGNHEYYAGFEGWRAELERLEVFSLLNDHTTISRGAGRFTLAGVNDVAGEDIDEGPDFDRALAGTSADNARILLAHQPVLIDDAVRHGVDLQLSGHTHGGQMWPGSLLVGLQQPSVAGLSKVDDTMLYVTRGAGFWGPPVRVGAPPDVSIVELGAGLR
ncbi:metallophosphoesterase [Tamaricihabitans halophyticus]|nr:metallophosphoesterase [Tamaricihabitans halophyticus]